jgi:hypothetical protein
VVELCWVCGGKVGREVGRMVEGKGMGRGVFWRLRIVG